MKYIGSELEIFAEAVNWKSYFKIILSPYIFGDVLEVGAGLGGTTKLLFNEKVSSWLAIEPDELLIQKFESNSELAENRKISSKVAMMKDMLKEERKFDAILYIDVLEHIEFDKDEVEFAARLLKKGGNLIILSPAHQYLFSEFDTAIGHFRRYNIKQLKSLIEPKDFEEKKLIYLDSIGWFLSCANRFIFKKSQPSLNNILFWDRVVVPISKKIDKLICYLFGKTVIGIWSKK